MKSFEELQQWVVGKEMSWRGFGDLNESRTTTIEGLRARLSEDDDIYFVFVGADFSVSAFHANIFCGLLEHDENGEPNIPADFTGHQAFTIEGVAAKEALKTAFAA